MFFDCFAMWFYGRSGFAIGLFWLIVCFCRLTPGVCLLLVRFDSIAAMVRFGVVFVLLVGLLFYLLGYGGYCVCSGVFGWLQLH